MTPSTPGKSPSASNHPAPTPTPVRVSLILLFFLLIKLMPTDLASAYIISPIARPDLALQHLQYARTASLWECVFTSTQHCIIPRTGRPRDSFQSRRGTGSLYV